MCPHKVSAISAPTSVRVLTLIFSISIMCLLLGPNRGSASEDHEHAKFLKSFVPDHPHLHALVDKTHEGDVDAKHKFERESLSVRFNKTKSSLPAGTDEEHVVLYFLDDYTAHVTGGTNDHKFMTLEPFIAMLSKEDKLKVELVELGKKLERAECDYTCLGDQLTRILNDSIDKLSGGRTEL